MNTPKPTRSPPTRLAALTWLRMTRPAFLLLTVVACALGTATAAACGCGLNIPLALSATGLAVMAHATGNVLNDWHDSRNGADAANQQGVFPSTGGSRLIQNGEASEKQTSDLVKALLIFLVPAGLLLAVKTGPGVLLLGLAGLLLAWAYSAPPLKLMSRGLGELAVALTWFLVVVGADYVQRRQFFVIPASAAASLSLLVAALLVINGVPDARADAQVGKRTLVVRLGVNRAAALYGFLVLLAHGWLAASVWLLIPPKPALALTVAATMLHGLGMAWGFAQIAQLHN